MEKLDVAVIAEQSCNIQFLHGDHHKRRIQLLVSFDWMPLETPN